MNLNLIVEGPDRVGKSTLIKNLKKYYNGISFYTLHYEHISLDSKEKQHEYDYRQYRRMFELMETTSYAKDAGIICDRSHLGEAVYGPIYRNSTNEYIYNLESEYLNKPFWRNTFLILLTTSPSVLVSRDDGNSISAKEEMIQKEIENFEKAFANSLIQNKISLRYDVNMDKKSVADKIINQINQMYFKL